MALRLLFRCAMAMPAAARPWKRCLRALSCAFVGVLLAIQLHLPIARAEAPRHGPAGAGVVGGRALQRTVRAQRRVAVRTPAYAQELRAALQAAGAEHNLAGHVLYHQIKDAGHRAQWSSHLQRKGLAGLGEWLGSGRYPGIWTTPEAGGWYGGHGGKPVEIRLKAGALFIDLEEPRQRQVYEQWKQRAGVRNAEAKDLFQQLKDADGIALARKVGAIRAPQEGRFFQELNIAGVVWHDVYGRPCPVILNPGAVADVKF